MSNGDINLRFDDEIQGCLDGSTNGAPTIYNFDQNICSSVPPSSEFNCDLNGLSQHLDNLGIPKDELASSNASDAIWVGCGVRETSEASFIFAQYYVRPNIRLDENECQFVNIANGEVTTGCFIKPKAGADLSFFINNINLRVTLTNTLNAERNNLSGLSGASLTAKQQEITELQKQIRVLGLDYVAECYRRSL